MLSEKEKAERYDLIVGYFQTELNRRVDLKIDDMVYYDGAKQARHKDLTEREEEVEEEFIYEMDNIGFWDFAELMCHEIFCERVSENNQFHDHVYG